LYYQFVRPARRRRPAISETAGERVIERCLLAPTDIVSGGRLAAAVSHEGGLGLIGGGYGDGDWIER